MLWSGTEGEEGQRVAGSLNNQALLLVGMDGCGDDGGSPKACSFPISFMATKTFAVSLSVPLEQRAKLAGHGLFPGQLIKRIHGDYTVRVFRNFLFGFVEVCSYFVFADCSKFTWELISAWFLLSTSNCVDYNFLGQAS